MITVENIKFDANGLVPVIVQDNQTGEVLTLAYMNKESLLITLEEKRTCFFSRSRQELWRKGETSGNLQHVVSITADCDNDALLVKVNKEGPACHTGKESCFFSSMYSSSKSSNAQIGLTELYTIIKERKDAPQERSYTSYLFKKGVEKILKKVGEESTEVVIAAMKNENQETIFEIADLSYHLLVLMAELGISVQDVQQELGNRHVIDKKVKQETMQ